MKKKVLILGGTLFTGRMLTDLLMKQNDIDLTLFNRGKSNINLFKDVQQLHGNRESDDVHILTQENWDVVVDFSGYYPNTFDVLLASLRGKVRRYIFVSTLSVFDISGGGNLSFNEQSPTLTCSAKERSTPLPDAYGAKKAEMERMLMRESEMETLIFRPSFIYGAYDWTNRFYYWIQAAKQSGVVLLPPSGLLSLTYANDFANALVYAVNHTLPQQVYHCVTHNNVSIRQITSAAAEQLNTSVQLMEISPSVAELASASYFPLALPFNLQVSGELWQGQCGIKPTPLEQTIAACIDYAQQMNWPEPGCGPSKQVLMQMYQMHSGVV